MRTMLLIAIGGAAGALARAGLATAIGNDLRDGTRLPLGTLTVNLVGCTIAGLLLGLSERLGWADAPWFRPLIFVGLLGGFTTFSAFGIETLDLLRRQAIGLAVLYVLISVVVGLALLSVAFLAVAPAPSASSL